MATTIIFDAQSSTAILILVSTNIWGKYFNVIFFCRENMLYMGLAEFLMRDKLVARSARI